MFTEFGLGHDERKVSTLRSSVQPFGSAKDGAVSTQTDGIPLNRNSLGTGIKDLMRIESWKLCFEIGEFGSIK